MSLVCLDLLLLIWGCDVFYGFFLVVFMGVDRGVVKVMKCISE